MTIKCTQCGASHECGFGEINGCNLCDSNHFRYVCLFCSRVYLGTGGIQPCPVCNKEMLPFDILPYNTPTQEVTE